MFGFRTPVKAAKTGNTNLVESPERPERAGPSGITKVRRSIGDWEAGKVAAKPKSPTIVVAPTAPVKSKPKATLSLGSKTDRVESFEVTGSPPERVVFVSRVAEARAYLTKAKTHLGNSRNLKTDIKSEVTLAIERLYQLVKEAEAEAVTDQTAVPKTKKGKEEKESASINGKGKEELDLVKTIEEHKKLIQENNERMETLKEALEKQNVTLERTTYASVARGNIAKRIPEQAALHSVVVTSKDEMETGEEVLAQIREVVNAKEGWVKVERVRKAKDRKVIVGCSTEGERKKVIERLKKADKLHVEEIKNKDPLLILRDVLQFNSDDDIVNALRNQNRDMFKDLNNEEDRMEIRYRRRARNPHASHVVMRVSPTIWSRMVEAEAVHVDLQRVRVEDHSPLVQCSLCLGYGHGRRFCRETILKCSHCGGPHMKTDCADWLANALPSCCNCTRAKLDKTEHNAFSEDCPIRRKWETLARATIAYC